MAQAVEGLQRVTGAHLRARLSAAAMRREPDLARLQAGQGSEGAVQAAAKRVERQAGTPIIGGPEAVRRLQHGEAVNASKELVGALGLEPRTR